jgi:cell division protein FtsA
VRAEITEYRLQPFIGTGLVLTGGGSLLAGLDVVAQEMCAITVRKSSPRYSVAVPPSLCTPLYATAYGLLVHALKKRAVVVTHRGQTNFALRVLDCMKSWVKEFF